ncbi:MAG: fluoride efflux transporter CrcB [Deltaproteobacteria bacterium]|nr:fluoride efflux transporter CrcB [Deltaproteobacteria bacterium]
MRWLWVFLGGGIGSVLRYLVGGWVQGAAGTAFPWGTFVVNASGCFAIGVLATWLTERSAPAPELGTFLLVGVLGGYTTFSSFGIETFRLLEAAAWLHAAGNALGSMAAGLAGVTAGVLLARSVP